MKTRLYLDSNIFIYTIEEYPVFSNVLDRLEMGILNGKIQALTSEVTLSEVLVKPIADGDVIKIQAYHRSMRNGNTFTVVPVDRSILIEAATVRANSNLKLPDAIHLATAILHGCTHFVTNDQHFKNYQSVKVLLLQELQHLLP